MASRRLSTLAAPELGYLLTRIVVAIAILVLYAGGILVLPNEAGVRLMFEVGLALFSITSAACLIAMLRFGTPMRTTLLVALPVDLLTGSVLLVSTHSYQDPIYVWFVGMVLIYAVVFDRRESDIVSALVAVTYAVGHFVAAGDMRSVGDFVLVAFKAAALVFVGSFISGLVHRQLEREAELEASRDSIEDLNEQLQRRLADLNAVSEITEVVHSSLDFDAIGPLVLDIMQKVIDVSACSLLVLDREKAETLFSVSTDTGDLSAREMIGRHEGETVRLATGEFGCLTILDHGQMMVVFCAPAAEIDQMRVEDRLMLAAVASELAVAVENSQLYKLTKRLSITDELTGLHNYRYLQQRLEEEAERAMRYDRPLSLLMLDADEFKNFNDMHGHVAGDQALLEIGGVVKSRVREIDVVARYGGEEFAVILPETDAAGAFVAAEKVREAVTMHRFADEYGERDVRISVSIGLASMPAHATDKEALLRQADDALYQAKRLGRDLVRAATASVAASGRGASGSGPAAEAARAPLPDPDIEELPA